MNELPQKSNFWPKLTNKFAVIYVILGLLAFLTEIVFILAQNDVLKGTLIVIAGPLLLIWALFTTIYWVRIRSGFQNTNPQITNETKLQRAIPLISTLLFFLLIAAFIFVQDPALREKVVDAEVLIFFIVAVLYLYDWVQRRKQK